MWNGTLQIERFWALFDYAVNDIKEVGFSVAWLPVKSPSIVVLHVDLFWIGFVLRVGWYQNEADVAFAYRIRSCDSVIA